MTQRNDGGTETHRSTQRAQRQTVQRAEHGTEHQSAQHTEDANLAPEGPDAIEVALTALPLIGSARLNGRGNEPVRIAMMQRLQSTQGNHAVQRFLQRAQSEATIQRTPVPATHVCGPDCNHEPVQRTQIGGVHTGTGAPSPVMYRVRASNAPLPIRRHAAYEHYLLG
ncbi:MAG: hypothetical protein IVW55_09950 [Chloroflexi bacterium]|nr:hypothetical protein [Chloroflexota bacterium]